MASDVQIAGGVGAAPQAYTVPNATEIIPKAITAVFDGTGAATSFLPTVEIVSDGGVVVARVPTTTTVAAGGSAEVTFAPFLRGIPAGSAATGFLAELLLSSPDALWKLNELAGATAFDSLAGHHDAGQVGAAPTWGSSAPPPGGTSALFPVSSGFLSSSSGYTPVLTGDFTAAVFAQRSANTTMTLFGQDQPVADATGWEFMAMGVSDLNPNHWAVHIGGAGLDHVLPSVAAISGGAWYWLALTHAAGLWTFYVNGSPQATTYAGAHTGAANRAIWIAWDNVEAFSQGGFNLAYATLWATRALSASEIAGLYLSL